jgi:hypothetical protein
VRRLGAARRGAVITAVLAVLMGLAGLAWGWAGPPRVAASPSAAGSAPVAGSPSASTVPAAAAVPAAWAVPAAAIARLTELARRAAAANGDASPEWMTAVLTTHAKALTSATPGDLVPGTGRASVYLVTMRGHFIAYGSSPPAGAALPAGEYLSLVVDARTFRVLDFGLSPTPPPVAPASLGPVTYLAGRGA